MWYCSVRHGVTFSWRNAARETDQHCLRAEALPLGISALLSRRSILSRCPALQFTYLHVKHAHACSSSWACAVVRAGHSELY